MLKYIPVLFVICLFGLSNEHESLRQDIDIPMDKARVTVVTDNVTINISKQSEECYKCDLSIVERDLDGETNFTVDTRWKTRLQISVYNGTSETSNCSEKYLTHHFKEDGNYTIHVKYDKDDNIICIFRLTNSPRSAYIPLYVTIGCFVALATIWILISKYCSNGIWRKCITNGEYEPLIDKKKVTLRKDGSLEHSGLLSSLNGSLTSSTDSSRNSGRKNVQPNTETKIKKERLKSLDTFRGISIVIMIFVNYGGGGYWFFSHSKWNGLTVADLVFPWFIFIMGTSMAYSFTSLLRKNTPKYLIFWKIFRRSCILFLLGLVINTNGCSSIDVKNLRIPGVLQRFAITYFIIATMHMCFTKLTADTHLDTKHAKVGVIRDIIDYWPEWIINFGFITLHCCLTFLLDVPGCKRGYLGPGGMEDHSDNFNCTGGAAAYIDRKIFGVNHIYGSPTCKEIYHNTMPHEPEGLLGTLTSCVLCFLGLQAGKILMIYKDKIARIIRFCVWGCTLGLLAGILCKFSKNDGWIPINKNLWSLSFILCLAGFAFFLLCFCYLMIDEWKIWNGAPFYYPGMNAILVYMGHELFHHNFPISWDVPDTHGSKLPLDLYGASFWVIVATYLYYKGSFYVI